MKRQMHIYDVVALIAGVYALLSPIWTTTTTTATWTMVVLGIFTAGLVAFDLYRPDVMASEALVALMGVLFFISPWVLSFSDTRPISWTAWIAGVIVFVVGAADLQVTRSHRQGTVAQH